MTEALDRAADLVRDADALLVCAGAGMGVDSGLPDFRGTSGFWRAYPPYERLGLGFEELADPVHFAEDPALAWGFYGHRLHLYRGTTPHAGFGVLRAWGARVLTSNVDGQFQEAGFPHVAEVHGSIHHLQCLAPCSPEIWSAAGVEVRIDAAMRALKPLPQCGHCGGLARPNILMFGDGGWLAERSRRQIVRYNAWLDDATRGGGRLVVIEVGAGTAIPTVRIESERVVVRRGATLVRINPRDARVPALQVSLPTGAVEGLRAIDGRLGNG